MMGRRWIWVLLFTVLAGCGYRFPGEMTNRGMVADLEGAVIRVSGPGAEAYPLLARTLRQKLETRLLITPAGSDDASRRVLQVRLESPQRILHSEDQSGQADQYRILLRGQPTLWVDGAAVDPRFPMVEGMATYNELRVVTASRATRAQAMAEALNQLGDSMVAVLTGSF